MISSLGDDSRPDAADFFQQLFGVFRIETVEHSLRVAVAAGRRDLTQLHQQVFDLAHLDFIRPQQQAIVLDVRVNAEFVGALRLR